MTLQTEGQISFGNIAEEMQVDTINVSLTGQSTDNVNGYSEPYPNATAPYAISEFYSYNHTAGQGRSERRLKYNIEYIADSPMGIPMYYFNYINEAHGKGKFIGTMTDDLERLGFSDVLSTVDGNIFVNYSKIDVPFAQIED